MDSATKKTLFGAATAALAALVFGENQILEMDERLQALEDIHPELEQEELDELSEELQSDDEEQLSDEEQIEADEAEAEEQPLIEADKE